MPFSAPNENKHGVARLLLAAESSRTMPMLRGSLPSVEMGQAVAEEQVSKMPSMGRRVNTHGYKICGKVEGPWRCWEKPGHKGVHVSLLGTEFCLAKNPRRVRS